MAGTVAVIAPCCATAGTGIGAGVAPGEGAATCQIHNLESKKGLHCAYANCAITVAMGVNLAGWWQSSDTAARQKGRSCLCMQDACRVEVSA